MRSKIAVDDLVVGIACDATANCALRANDLLAFARDQHVTGSLLHAVSERDQIAWQRSGLAVRRGDLPN